MNFVDDTPREPQKHHGPVKGLSDIMVASECRIYRPDGTVEIQDNFKTWEEIYHDIMARHGRNGQKKRKEMLAGVN